MVRCEGERLDRNPFLSSLDNEIEDGGEDQLSNVDETEESGKECDTENFNSESEAAWRDWGAGAYSDTPPPHIFDLDSSVRVTCFLNC